MSTNGGQENLARLMKNMNMAFDQHKDITLPLDKITTRKFHKNLDRLTRLYRLPTSNLRDGVKRGVYYNRLKARRLLLIILEKYGPVAIFLCSQATNETQLGRLNTDAVLEELESWHTKVAQPQALKDAAEHLLNQSQSAGAHGATDPRYAARSIEPEDHAEQLHGRSAMLVKDSSMASDPAHQMPKRTILQIEAAYLADFLKRESGGVLNIICEQGREPALPYTDFGREQEHRVTMSYGLGSALVQYMKQLDAEPRSDGTFALTDTRR